MLIKLWNWERKWMCIQVCEGHSHYVMDVVFNPKDNNQFASASMDRTVKVDNAHTHTASFKYISHISLRLLIFSNIWSETPMTFNRHIHRFCHSSWCRCGSWAPRAPTSLWRATTRGWTASATTAVETNPTSYRGLTTAWPRSGTIRYKRVAAMKITRAQLCRLVMCLLDCQNKTCIHTLEGHTNNINCVSFFPQLPIILTGSEDGGCQANTNSDTFTLHVHDTGSEFLFHPGTIRVWHRNTYRLESTLDYNLERVWCLCTKPFSNIVALGFDNGTMVIQVRLPVAPYCTFTWKPRK